MSTLVKFFFLSFIACVGYTNTMYLKKFQTYRFWYTHLPPQAQPDLIRFIQQPGPLSQRLRETWLNYLGEKKQWPLFVQYYHPNHSIKLQCYAATAYWHTNHHTQAIQIATPLWLTGHPQPQACNEIFQILNKQPQWHAHYWAKRIIFALDNQELLLARQLLHRGNSTDRIAADNFWRVHTQPSYFMKLPQQKWLGEQTLYALKRMIDLKQKKYLQYYQFAQIHHYLNFDQKQRFIAHQALYSFMRNAPDANAWMAQLTPHYYHSTLLEWQMRYAILHQRWATVAIAIHHIKPPYTPEQSYWLAQAEKHLHEKTTAQKHLKALASQRHYYGFLAARELHVPLSFQENPSCQKTLLPYTYQPILNEVQRLYRSKTLGRAAQILNDFILELPQQEKCALVHWVLNYLNWPTEAIALSNQPALINQISVRFPTKYVNFVTHRAKLLHLDPAFVYAIIRQESAFHPQITSPVGARGLMQMMPHTAKLITRSYRIPYHLDAELFTPYKNIEIGTQYLAHLAKLFKKHPLLIAAAYNAGPQAVHQWMNLHPHQDIIAWIDTLPWKETRNYLKNIIAFQIIYQHRLGYKPNMEHMLASFPYQHLRHNSKI